MQKYRNIDYSNAYAKHYGLKKILEEEDSVVPLLPFLLWHCAYQYYMDHLKEARLTHLAVKHCNKWRDAYNRVNGRLYRACKGEMESSLIVLMNTFLEDLSHDLTITWYSADRIYSNGTTAEQQEILTAALLVNNLCLKAASVYVQVFKTFLDPDVAAMLVSSRDLAKAYIAEWKIPDTCTEVAYKQFSLAANVLSNKIKEWARKEDLKSNNNVTKSA